MTSKEAILSYLQHNRTFCTNDICVITGLSRSSVNQAANRLLDEGYLVVDSRVWRSVHYRASTEAERSGQVSTNMIFNECRKSPAMQRILAVYGVRA